SRRPPSQCGLKQELEPELEEAREVRLHGRSFIDRAELDAVRVGVVTALVVHRRVKDVVCFGAELEPHPLANAEHLGKVEVELLEPRATNTWVADRCRPRGERLANEERPRSAAIGNRVGQQRVGQIAVPIADIPPRRILDCLRYARFDALNQLSSVNEALAVREPRIVLVADEVNVARQLPRATRVENIRASQLPAAEGA